MSEHFFIKAASVIYGATPHTGAFLEKWLRNIPIGPILEQVLTEAHTHGSRETLLAASVQDIEGFAPELQRVDWQAFRAKPFHGYSEAIVVAVQDSKDGQAAVAIHVHRHEGLVEVHLGTRGEERVIEVPNTTVAAMLRLAVSFLCVRHGVLPGALEPRLWWDDVRALRVGSWSVSTREPPSPLPFFRPEIWTMAATTHDALRQRIKTKNLGGEGSFRAVIVGEPWNREARFAEAVELMEAGRSFSYGIWITNQDRVPSPMYLAPGPFETSLLAGGALAACHSEWRNSYPKTGRSSGEPASRAIQHIAISQWFCARMLRLMQNLLSPGPLLTESIAGHYFDDSIEIESPLWSEQLAGDFTTLREWLAERSDVGGATAEHIMWQSWLILGPLDVVDAALANTDRVFRTVVRTPNECIIAGTPDALDDVLLVLLDSPRIMASELEFSAVLHCPPARSAKDQWERWWPSSACPIDTEVDLRAPILDAHNHGHRLFVDIGPTGQFANWMDRNLDDRDHLSIPSARSGVWGPLQLFFACAQLEANGLEVERAALEGFGRSAPELNWNKLPPPRSIDAVLREVSSLNKKISLAHETRLRALTSSFNALTQAHQSWVKVFTEGLPKNP